MSRSRYDPTRPYDPEQHLRWLRQHSYSGLCADCHGPGRLPRLADHVQQTPMVCPKCKRVWVYRVDMAREVKRRVVWCRIARHQPFLMSVLPRSTC